MAMEQTDFSYHSKLVHFVIKRYFRTFTSTVHSYDDLFQTGCIGLCKADQRFDEGKGHKFSTYAVFCIRSEIGNYLRDNQWIHVPRVANELARRVRMDKNEHMTVDELVSTYKIRYKDAQHTKQFLDLTNIPLDSPLRSSDGERVTVGDMLPSSADLSSVFVDEFLDSLSDREAAAVRLTMQGAVQSRVGELLGVSQISVSRILKRVGNRYLEYLKGGGEEDAGNNYSSSHAAGA